MGHGAANPLVAAVLLDVGDPLLTLTHDFGPLQVEVFVDHLQTHMTHRLMSEGQQNKDGIQSKATKNVRKKVGKDKVRPVRPGHLIGQETPHDC